jgi:putative transposase
MKVNYEEKSIRVTIKPGEYIEVSLSSRWFTKRVENWRNREVVLKDDRVLIPFKSTRVIEVRNVVAWDSNELSLDGFSLDIGFIRVDLKPLQSMKIMYEMKKREESSTKQGLKDIYEKYVAREPNRERDFMTSSPPLKGECFFWAAHWFPASIRSYNCPLRGSRGGQRSPHYCLY